MLKLLLNNIYKQMNEKICYEKNVEPIIFIWILSVKSLNAYYCLIAIKYV